MMLDTGEHAEFVQAVDHDRHERTTTMTHRFSGWYKAMVVKSEVLGEGFQVGKLAAFSKVGDSIVVTNWERFVTLTTEQAQVALKAWRDRKHKSPKYPEGPLVPVSDGPSIERKYARVR